MDGIAVIIAPSLGVNEREACVRRMLRTIGLPEGAREPVLSLGPCTLGALAPTSPTTGEIQAWMATAHRGRYHALLCGEITSGPEVLDELASHDIRVPEASMPALLAEAFALWGGASLRRLRGAVGAAVWDAHEERLTLSRDALGLRPVFFAQHGSVFVAASELRALCASGLVPVDLSSEAVRDCLVHGAPVAPRTAYRSIHALRPGECLTWHQGHTESKSFWTFKDFSSVAPAGSVSNEEFTEEFRLRLQAALRRSLGTSVLTGCLLGNDTASCLLAGSAARVTAAPLRTFSLCFADELHRSVDEGPRIARHFGTRHESLLIDGNDIARDLDQILATYDQPGDADFAGYYLGNTAAQAGLSMLLAPIGAEALFGLHDWFTPPLAPHRESPRWLKAMRQMGTWLGGTARKEKALAEFKRAGASLHELAALQRRFVTEAERESILLSPGPFAAHDELSFLTREVTQDHAELVGSAWDLRTRLCALNIPDCRRGAAVHQMGVRLPFLDMDLVDWCRAHPTLARQALSSTGGLPRAWADLLLSDTQLKLREDVAPPFARWWRGPLRNFGEHTFSETSISQSGFLRADVVRKIWIQARQDGPTNWRFLWRLAVLINFLNRRTQAL